MHKTFGKGRKAGLFSNSVLLSILLFIPFLLFTACPGEDPASASSEKDITAVTLQRETVSEETTVKTDIPGIVPAIDAENGAVVVTVPRGTPIDTVYLQVEVSESAAADPTNDILAGRIMNYNGEKITVTAEDGSTKGWTVSAVQDPSPVQHLSVELLGNYQVRFLFAYPNYKEINGDTRPDLLGENPNSYPLAYSLYNEDGSYNPILLSYFVDDNDITKDTKAITYYNTLVVSAGGLDNREWKIDGKMAPIHEGSTTTTTPPTNDSTTLTIHAQDWTLEDLHTVTLFGTKTDKKGNEQKYSGEFTFRVVEKAPAAAE
jgi:hypothetical protein